MQWHELIFVALLAVAALAIVGWISRQLQRPLEWMIDSQLDPAAELDFVQHGPYAVQAPADPAARDARLRRGW